MSTRHVMRAERRDVTTRPSLKTIKRKLKHAQTLGDFEMRPGYLYTVVRAISARVNQNYDGWPSDELKKAAHTFVGKPVFVNHENHDPTKARGVVVASRYVEAGNDKYIEVIQEIDAKRFPKLAHEIRTGGLDSVSMGAEAGFTICSYCGNKAQDVPDMCDHVLFHKGERLAKFDRKTGKREKVLVYESCHKLSFFELSYVFDPADETAVASKVLVASNTTDEDYAAKVLRTAGFHVHSIACPPGEICNPVQAPQDQQMGPDHNFASGGDSGAAAAAAGAAAPTDTSATGVGPSPVSPAGGIPLVQKPDGTWTSTDPAWAHLINRESGGNPSITQQIHDVNSGGNEAQGLFQITPQTWKSNGGSQYGDSPGKATPQQQAEIAKAIFTKNPSGSDWGAGLSGREDAAALAKGFSPTTTQKTVAPTQHTPTQPAVQQKAASRRRVADTCHYCKNPAEDGRKSCSAHSKMEDAKYVKAVLANFYRQAGPPPGPTNHTGIQSQEGMAPEDYVVPYQGRGYTPGTPVDVYRNLHADRRQQGMWSHKQNGLVIGHSDFVHMPDGQFFVGEAGNQRVQETGQKTVHAGARGVLGPVPPDDHGPYTGITYNPKAGDTTFIQRESREPVHAADHVHLGPDGKAYAVNPRGQQTFEARVLEVAGYRTDPHYVARVLQAWGEEEAPAKVDTWREEGTAAEDDNNDFYEYVKPPKELQAPDLSEAAQIDREQEDQGQDPMAGDPAGQQQAGPPMMTIQIPVPQQGQAGAPGAGTMPMQPFQDTAPSAPPPLGGPTAAPPGQPMPAPAPPAAAPPDPTQQIAASTLDYFDRYFGRRTVNWYDAVLANRPFTAAEAADYRRQAVKVQTLENRTAASTTSRNPMKGTANMANSTLASRGRQVTAGRRQHFAEGPLVDTGDQSRNDEGEQEEVFISQVPPAERAVTPKDGQEISNTENNLVARVQAGRAQLLADAQRLAEIRAYRQATGPQPIPLPGTTPAGPPTTGLDENGDHAWTTQTFNPTTGSRRRHAVEESGGPVATEVNPQVQTGPEGEALTGDDFESADPNADVQETQPKDASLHAFRQFDRWLAASTGKPSRSHNEATIKRAAVQFTRQANISVQAMYPALGIVLREARKNEKVARTKGAKMRKRADEKLEVAAPDDRIDVEAPTEDTTDAEAQASQFDLHDFGNNAGDNIADPDLSTSQNWAPGEAKQSSVKTAGGILGFRLAEAMIAAGLEPNDHQRKYALAAHYENMNRSLVQNNIGLCERFAGVLQQVARQQVASGSTRGAALKPPVPSGLGAQRTAGRRVAANDPSNDSGLFI